MIGNQPCGLAGTNRFLSVAFRRLLWWPAPGQVNVGGSAHQNTLPIAVESPLHVNHPVQQSGRGNL
jgi:hypothetical protein